PAHGGGRNDAAIFVILAQHLVRVPVLPRGHAEMIRPSVGVALALHAQEHGCRHVLVRFRIAARLVVAYPEIEAVARHERLDAAVMKRWHAFSGMENSEPFCHSNTWRFVWPSCQTSVVPRPSMTNTTFS